MSILKFENNIINEDVDRIISENLKWDKFRGTTVLVTGASGMIPSYVVYTLINLNDTMDLKIKVVALVRNEIKARRVFSSIIDRPDFTLLIQDVVEPVNIQGHIDYIIHGASTTQPSDHKTRPTATLKANLIGTMNLLDLAVEKSARGFVLMSSSEVYGQVDSSVKAITETDYGYLDCLNPRSCYSEGKRAAETLCASYKSQYDIDCRIARFAHIYGPGIAINDGRVQAEFASKVFRNENIVMNSNGSSRRAYTYVSDAVAGLFFILLKGEDMVYNVADSSNIISIRQLAEAFIAARPEGNLRLQMNIDKKNIGMYNPAAFIGLDNSKLVELGWAPKITISEGTKRMLMHYEITETEKEKR